MLVALEKQYRERGVLFIGASLDDAASSAKIPAFLQKYSINFPVWTGATGDDLARLQLGEAVPATAFINRDGEIAARISGQTSAEEISARVNWLLGDRTGPAPLAYISHVPK